MVRGTAMPHKLPKHVRPKRAKGKTYYYFDTGRKSDVGKPILTRLPDIKAPDFGSVLAALQAARTRRGLVQDTMTVNRLADLWEKSPDFRGYAESTQTSYRLYPGVIRERLGIAPANELTPEDVNLLRDEMADTPGAANQFVSTLGSLYKWGRKRHVKAKPTEGVEKFDSDPHPAWPEWLLAEALADPEIGLPVSLMYFTAQRIGDVCAMRWRDMATGPLKIVQQKTGKSLTIPVHGELRALLDRAPRTGLHILLRPDGMPWKVHSLREKLQAWAKERGQKVVPHGLRKNAVIALLECGCSMAETAAISGQTLQMVEHYARDRNQERLASAAILRWEKKS